MFNRTRIVRSGALAFACFAPALFASAQAAPVVVNLNASYAAAPIDFTFEGATFTFTSTGDFTQPTAVQTSSTGAVRSFGGFLFIPLQPSSDFPDRGSGIISYGPGTPFASFLTAAAIPYSNGDNYLGLRATVGNDSYYGYAFTTDTTLNSFAFETTPNTAITLNTSTAVTAVPEAATWAMMVGGFAAIGGALRRKRPTVSFA